MYKHVIPLGSKFIIPKEVPHHFRSCILKNSSGTILWRASLENPLKHNPFQSQGLHMSTKEQHYKARTGIGNYNFISKTALTSPITHITQINTNLRRGNLPQDLYAKLDSS
jgi:hypothetical protein